MSENVVNGDFQAVRKQLKKKNMVTDDDAYCSETGDHSNVDSQLVSDLSDMSKSTKINANIERAMLSSWSNALLLYLLHG